jgi:hypothetical protein
VECR